MIRFTCPYCKRISVLPDKVRDLPEVSCPKCVKTKASRRVGNRRPETRSRPPITIPGLPPRVQGAPVDNKTIIERIFAFQVAVRGKNDAIAAALQRATIPLLEYPRPLAQASRHDLLDINGVGPATVAFIQRIIAGEDIDCVVADVPKIVHKPQERPTQCQSKDKGNWNGSWDNTVRQLEGD